MVDNVQVTAGTGTSIATDDVGGVQFQRVKVTWGADGVATDVSTASPLPVGIDQTTPGTTNGVQERGYQGVVAMTVGAADATPRRSIGIICTVAGNVVLKLADDSNYTVPVVVGLNILPFAVKGVVTSGTTATATYANLI